MQIKNVLSFFDGMSCGQLALKSAGISYENYYAAEIDRHAIQITQKNFPATIQLGSVVDVHVSAEGIRIGGPRPYAAKHYPSEEKILREIPTGKIDLFFGGSPCQSLSNAGDGSGFDGKSGLFYEWLRVLREIQAVNPDLLFLLENVKMKDSWRDVISKELGVEPILINSSLVSAQNRQRYYWTNIPNIKQPADRGIRLVDVLDPSEEVDQKYYHTKTAIDWMGAQLKDGRVRWSLGLHGDTDREKAACLVKSMHKGQPNNVIIDRRIQKLSRKLEPKVDSEKASTLINGGNGAGNHRYTDWIKEGDVVRRYTPEECERLQTVPEGYTEGVSNTQRYTMLGNGWTVEVIAHIFKHIKDGAPPRKPRIYVQMPAGLSPANVSPSGQIALF